MFIISFFSHIYKHFFKKFTDILWRILQKMAGSEKLSAIF